MFFMVVDLPTSLTRLNYRLAKASSDLRTAETTFVRGYLYGRVGIPRNVKAECVIRPKR